LVRGLDGVGEQVFRRQSRMPYIMSAHHSVLLQLLPTIMYTETFLLPGVGT
jgi:hypothetical protein